MQLFALSEEETALCHRVYEGRHATLEDTTKVIEWNPSDYTAWVVRRRLLPASPTLTMDAGELQFTKDVILKDPKSYQAWYHRRHVMSALLERASQGRLQMHAHLRHRTLADNSVIEAISQLIESELATLAEVMDDPKNHNVWQYRQWLLAPVLTEERRMAELTAVEKYLETDFRNNSVWSYRRWLVYERPPSEDAAQKALALKEVKLACHYLLTADPSDEALLTHIMSMYPWAKEPEKESILTFDEIPDELAQFIETNRSRELLPQDDYPKFLVQFLLRFGVRSDSLMFDPDRMKAAGVIL